MLKYLINDHIYCITDIQNNSSLVDLAKLRDRILVLFFRRKLRKNMLTLWVGIKNLYELQYYQIKHIAFITQNNVRKKPLWMIFELSKWLTITL